MTFLKILMLEDSAADAELIQYAVKRAWPHCEFSVVMNEPDFLQQIEQFKPDLVLSDNTLPQFSATEALRIFKALQLPIPFILVTGTVSEEFAAGIIKLGADDYILKSSLIRLPAAMEAALKKRKIEFAIKQNEEIRKHILNASLDAIICIDGYGAITFWNLPAERLLGWRENEILGKNLADVIIPEPFRELHKKGYRRHLMNEQAQVLNNFSEVLVLNRAGQEIPAALATVSLRYPDGNFFCVFIRDLRETRKAAAALKEMERKITEQKIQEQKKISRAIIEAQEAEKNYIGQELHDNISQLLAGTKMFLSVAAKQNEGLRPVLSYPIELIENVIEELRLLSHRQVTPLKNIQLGEMIQELLHNLGRTRQLAVKFDYAISDELLSDDLKLNVYRLIQEQMNNIVKHAGASEVEISIKIKMKVLLVRVIDNGKGFVLSNRRKGIGISNMMNRVESYNGKMDIKSSPGNGCMVCVKIPVQSGE